MNPPITVAIHRIQSYPKRYPSIAPVPKIILSLELIKDPFEMSFEEYLHLSLEEVQKLQTRTLNEKRKWIEEKCREKKADWIVVCGGEVVLFGEAREKRPSKKELKEIGERYGKIPFLFFSLHFGPEIEESVVWYKTSLPDDYYPTMKIVVSSESGRKREITSTFDTGTWITHLDLDGLLEEGILSLNHLDFKQEDEFGRDIYYYYEKEVKISIVDENRRTKDANILCRCVRNWRNSPFWENYPNREALIGRDILLNFPIKVELNGKEKKTYIYLVEQNG